MRVSIARSFAQLRAWEPAYSRFLSGLGGYGVFYRQEWLASLWPAYARTGISLFFIGIWRDEELIAVAPLQLLAKGPSQAWRRVLSFVGTHHPTLSNPWPDILVAREEARSSCFQSIAAALSRCANEWDELDLRQLHENSPSLALLQSTWPQAELALEAERSGQVDLGCGFDAYLANLSSDMRKKLRWGRRQLDGLGQVRFHSSEAVSRERWECVSRMHRGRQERLSRKHADRHSVFAVPRESAAFRQAIDRAGEAGAARHYWLDIDGEAAAFALGLWHRNSYFYYLIGMEETVERYSGGAQLLLFLIEEETRRGTVLVDMLFGMNWNKTRFANRERSLYRCSIVNRQLASRMRSGWVRLAKKMLRAAEAPARPPGKDREVKYLPFSGLWPLFHVSSRRYPWCRKSPGNSSASSKYRSGRLRTLKRALG